MDELERIQSQIAELQRQADEIVRTKRREVIDEVRGKIASYKLTAKELGFHVDGVHPNQDKRKKPVAPRYVLGENTWTGRGKKPKWVREFEVNGNKLDDIDQRKK